MKKARADLSFALASATLYSMLAWVTTIYMLYSGVSALSGYLKYKIAVKRAINAIISSDQDLLPPSVIQLTNEYKQNGDSQYFIEQVIRLLEKEIQSQSCPAVKL